MSRQLADLRVAVMMIDRIELKERMMIVALRITTEGAEIRLGLWEGSTENATVATAPLVERGLDPEQGTLFVIDGSNPAQRQVVVLRWMGLRWTAAGMLEAEKQFRKVIGYTQLPALAIGIDADSTSTSHPTQAAAIAVTMMITLGPPSPKVPRRVGTTSTIAT